MFKKRKKNPLDGGLEEEEGAGETVEDKKKKRNKFEKAMTMQEAMASDEDDGFGLERSQLSSVHK